MKKIIFVTFFICCAALSNAQIQKSKYNTGNTPQTTNTATATVNDADYFLAVAKISIKTGKDNKEKGSNLILRVYPVSGTDNYRRGYCQENFKDELKIWNTDNFTLPRAANFDQNFNSLANYRQTGIMVDINYNTMGNGPLCLLDAWKIEDITVTLEFKNKNGDPHPTMGTKILSFSNSNMYLDYKKWQLYCKTDQYFNTLTPTITNRPQ